MKFFTNMLLGTSRYNGKHEIMKVDFSVSLLAEMVQPQHGVPDGQGDRDPGHAASRPQCLRARGALLRGAVHPPAAAATPATATAAATPAAVSFFRQVSSGKVYTLSPFSICPTTEVYGTYSM